MQKHAHACNNSYQALTPAFDGQVEDNPGTCYASHLTKDTSAFKLGPGNNPQMLGQAPPAGPRPAPQAGSLGN